MFKNIIIDLKVLQFLELENICSNFSNDLNGFANVQQSYTVNACDEKSKKKIVANNKEQKTIKINLFICVFSSSLCYYIRQHINQKDNENTKKYNG